MWDDLGETLAPVILAFLDAGALGAACRVARRVLESSEPAWRAVFDRRWGQSLFELKADATPSSWRSRCRARAHARRLDLQVVASRWLLRGCTEDRKGRVDTTAECTFAGSEYTMSGRAQHRRETGEQFEGLWSGNLCAHIEPGAGKRLWALGWRERLPGFIGCYDYLGRVVELPHGQLGISGEFKMLGGFRGTFEFAMTRAQP